MSERKLSEELAERGSDSLAKLFEGAFGVAEFMADAEVDVPGALGLSAEEWMGRRISGPVRLTLEERRKVVAELPPEMPTREVADALGVSHETIANDRRVKDLTSDPSETAALDPPPVRDLTPEPEESSPASDGMAVHYSSATDEWATPQDFFDRLDSEFGFDLDVCALDSSAKCERYFTPETDGLAREWHGTCWMNPPYGDAIAAWVEKAHLSAKAGATVVCLLPARVDTGWWWDHCRYGEVRFLQGRLKFGDSPNSAPFPSAVVVFRPDGLPSVVWWEPGEVVDRAA